MILLRSLDDFPESLRGGAVAVGNFDGVHLGHARLVERLRAMAAMVGGPAVVFTFDPSPTRVLRPDAAPEPLLWLERKVEILAGMGADALLVYPTDRRLLEMEARVFFDHIIRERLAARAMVEGPNFFFGHGRSGNVEVLQQFCAQAGMKFEVANPVEVGGQVVSSSRVRSLVAAGQVDEAAVMLGRSYRIRGVVVHGAGRGTKLGFPTANVGQIDTLLPGLGIYAGRARIRHTPCADPMLGWQFNCHPNMLMAPCADSGGTRNEPDTGIGTRSVPGTGNGTRSVPSTTDAWLPAAINLGPNSTFGEGAVKVEVHIVGFQGDVFGQSIEVDFLARLRDIVRFESVEALTTQIGKDVERTIEICH
jgi:riboflavin kinase / FMN adenylyltransferase